MKTSEMKEFELGFGLTLEELEILIKALEVYYSVESALNSKKWRKGKWEVVYNLQWALRNRLTDLQKPEDPFACEGKPIEIDEDDLPF